MEMTPMKKRVALSAVAALVVAACGGEVALEEASPSPTTPITTATTATPTPNELALTTTTVVEETTTTPAPTLEAAVNPQLRRIQASMAQSVEVMSARMTGEITMTDLEEFGQDIRMGFEAAFDNRTGDSSFAMDLSSLGDAIRSQMTEESAGTPEDEFAAAFAEILLALFTKFEVREVGDTVYMNNPTWAEIGGFDTPWIAGPSDENADLESDFLQGTPTNPKDLLEPFTNGGGEVIEIGPEVVRGVQTTHYQLIYGPEDVRLLAESGGPDDFYSDFADVSDELVIDIWVDDDYLYKLLIEIDGSQVDLPEEENFGAMKMVYEIYDYNADVVVEAPPADQVTFVDDLGMSGFGWGYED
jgi:hypothetical protein